MSQILKISYIEDHRSVKEGINYLLAKYLDFDVVENDFNVDKMDEFIRLHLISIFILDLRLQESKQPTGMSGYNLCQTINQRYPEIKIVVHSMYDHIDSVNTIFSKGAMGFVSKKSGHMELVKAIRSIAKGKKYICPEIVCKVKNAKKFLNNDDTLLKALDEPFTRTEKQILEKIAQGYSSKQIAQQLIVSEKTIETHRKHLFVKANVKNAAELIAYTYSKKLLID